MSVMGLAMHLWGDLPFASRAEMQRDADWRLACAAWVFTFALSQRGVFH